MMTKTKQQFRAEAVERLRELNAYVDGPESIVEKLAYGLDTDRFNYHVEIEHIIDLLADEEPRTNLEWLWENDRESIVAALCCNDYAICAECPFFKYQACDDNRSEWLMAECEGSSEVLAGSSEPECGPCYSCAKLAELRAENNALRGKCDELDNGNDGETNVITSGSPLVDELPNGDAPSEFAEILMALAADCSCMGDGIVRHFEPKDVQGDVDALMRVVERDYVQRDKHEDAIRLKMIDIGVQRARCNELEREGQAGEASAMSGGGKEREMIVNEWGGGKYAYYEESDLAECRVCHVRPVYKDGTSSSGGSYVRCPGCGIKTGTSTSGLDGVLPTWNRLMVDNWTDPKEAVE